MNYKQRDIIIVPFPFTDLSSIKQRPAVIISSDSFNKNEDVIVLAITSKIKAGQKFRVSLSNNNLEEGTIPKTSQIRCDKIYTLNQSIIRKKIAVLDKDTFNKVILELEKTYKSNS